jgi:hypothetical protein
MHQNPTHDHFITKNYKNLQWQIIHFILFSYPTTMYYDKNNYISVGMECFKSKACTQQTMTWLILNSQTQKHY